MENTKSLLDVLHSDMKQADWKVIVKPIPHTEFHFDIELHRNNECILTSVNDLDTWDEFSFNEHKFDLNVWKDEEWSAAIYPVVENSTITDQWIDIPIVLLA